MFKKGQSGNAKGRPKGAKSSAILFKERIFQLIRDRDPELQDLDMRDIAMIAAKFVPKEIVADVAHSGTVNIMPKVSIDGKPLKIDIGD